jgi:hypothetical protein
MFILVTLMWRLWVIIKKMLRKKQAESLTSLEIAGFLITLGDYILSITLTDLNSQIFDFVLDS